MLQHTLVNLVDGQKVAEDGLDLGLVEQRIIGLGQLLQFVFEELQRGMEFMSEFEY